MGYVIDPPPQASVAVAGSGDRFPIRRVFCVGRNYAAHAREMGKDPDREPPFFFTKPADAVVDAPCSGSGTWRRTPDAKWRLTEADLDRYIKIQLEILETAAELVSEAGQLCYATCSIFTDENEAQLSRFQAAHPGWIVTAQARADMATRGDGFFSASLRRS